MLAFAGGDEAAFEQLFERHSRAVIGVAMRYTRDRAAAEDLAQEAFLRVHRARATYVPTAKFSTWLFRIVTNLALNWSRNEQRRRHHRLAVAGATSTDLGVPEPIAENQSDPDARLENQELHELLAVALEALPSTQRLALILHRYEDLSYQEIAESMELSVKAVKSLLARGRQNLREKLAPVWARLEREL